MPKKLKNILVLGGTAILFLIAGQVMGLQIGALLSGQPQSIQNQNQLLNESVSFGQGEFTMTLPQGWVSDGGRAWNPNNENQFIIGGVINVENNATEKSLISEGKVQEFEIQRVATMCKETDACGKISEFKMVKASEGVQNFEFFITYPGTGVDEPDGFTTEIYRSVLANGKLYRFWTSTDSSAGKNASEIKSFRSIVDTFEVKRNQ